MLQQIKDIYFWICILELVVLATLASYILVNWGSSRFIETTIDELPPAQVVIILGAAPLKSGQVTMLMRDRADTAIAIYRSGKAQKMLVTGDNSSLNHNEVSPVRKYLLSAGVPDEDIVLDYAGFDTYSSMYRARDIFLIKKAIIVTQSFHLPRAVFLARELGIEAHGVSADRGKYRFNNYSREVFANVKAVLDIAFKRTPKYLGEVIPIERGATTTP